MYIFIRSIASRIDECMPRAWAHTHMWIDAMYARPCLFIMMTWCSSHVYLASQVNLKFNIVGTLLVRGGAMYVSHVSRGC